MRRPFACQANRGSRPRCLAIRPKRAESQGRFRQTRVSNETGHTHQWRMKRPHTQAHLIAPRGTGSTQIQPWTIPNRCTVNTSKAGTASRDDWLKPYRWADQCSRLAQRRGGENRKRGAGGGAGVMPRCLPGSESHRRIPASCPFPRNPCRQLRAT